MIVCPVLRDTIGKAFLLCQLSRGHPGLHDAVDELNGRGLVDVQHSEPKRFRAVSRETTGRRFEQRFTERLNRFRTALEALDTGSTPDEQRGVWTVTGRETITERVVEFIDAAEEEIVFVSVLVPNPEGTKDETAIWGAGERNSLVVVLRALFTWQLDSSSFE